MLHSNFVGIENLPSIVFNVEKLNSNYLNVENKVTLQTLLPWKLNYTNDNWRTWE